MIGIIDVGTNSIHLRIGALRRDGRFAVLRKEQHLTRLGGEQGLAAGRLSAAAMRRAMAVLRRYAATLKRYRVDTVEAVATSAVREARNGRAFVRRVRTRLRLPLRIISGREEARLIYLGVVPAQRRRHATALIAIGGGSIQVMHGTGRRLTYATSLPLGCARLAQRFIHHDPPRPEEISALDRYVRRRFTPVVGAMRRRRWRRALGSSATIHQVMVVASALTRRRGVRAPHPRSLSQRSLRQLVQRLSTSNAAARRRLRGLDPNRENDVLPTALALLAWMEGCRVSPLRAASGSLRDGLMHSS